MVLYNFKTIAVVPSASQMIDITLSMTQRKTPTVVHKGYKISRIRKFYMRKIKFTAMNYHEKFDAILNEFPRLDNIHPFYSDLINVLYSKDHYKLALGQISTVKSTIDNIAKDYIKLLKFGDSLYRCKELKRAALGRMSTVVKKLHASLGYLEQVRQHLSRLPSIDPSTRTLLITGYPNVGKSSFVNKISKANVDVQPYAFTTKSLFIGHFDYKYIRWQIIDTPGILDHPLEERNTIEMQAITALAHLHSTVLYFIDISEQCGYSIKQQCDLFASIKPLFANKPLLIVANKVDVTSLSSLSAADRALIAALHTDRPDTQLIECSNVTDVGIQAVVESACNQLLAARVERKLGGKKMNDILNRLHVQMPTTRDHKQRATTVPATVTAMRQQQAADAAQHELTALYSGVLDNEHDKSLPFTNTYARKQAATAKQLEQDRGGAGVYSYNWRLHWEAAMQQQHQLNTHYDLIPEIIDGKNISDYVDPDIEAKLLLLEAEEELLEQQYSDKLATAAAADDSDSDLEEDEAAAVQQIRDTKKVLLLHSNIRKSVANKPRVPRTVTGFRDGEQAATDLEQMGLNSTKYIERTRAASQQRQQKRARSESRAAAADDSDADVAAIAAQQAEDSEGEDRGRHRSGRSKVRALIRDVSVSRAASAASAAAAGELLGDKPFRDVQQQAAAKTLARQRQQVRNVREKTERVGESDRRFFTKMPKHLNSGKRGIGKTDYR